MSASVGIASFDETEPLNAAIERADAAMYEQKKSRRPLEMAVMAS